MVRFSALALVVAFGLALGISATLAATPHSSELWHLATINDPTNGKFTYCAVESSFDNKFSLAFARNRELNTNIVVTFPDARLTDHTKFHMDVVVDSGPTHSFVGFSANTQTLVIPLQHDRAVMESLQKGKLLELKGPEDSIKFALDGADDAVHQLQSCVEKNLKAEASNAGGMPEARPKVAAAPAAVDVVPSNEQMVEPLPLPGQMAKAEPVPGSLMTDRAPPIVSAPPVVIAEGPRPTVMTQTRQAPAAAPAATPTAPTQPATDQATEAKMEQDDEIAARAAAARLTAIREKAAADAKAKEDAAKAEAAKEEADKEAAAKAAADAEAAKQQAEQVAQTQAAKAEAARAQQAKLEADQKAQAMADANAQRQALDDAAAKAAYAKLDAEQATAKAKAQPAPAEAPTNAAVERPPVSSLPLPGSSSSGSVGGLGDLLRLAGLSASPVKGQASTYIFKSGAIAGEAMQSPSKKPFLDAMLDSIDSLEKGCKGPFSSSLGAPMEKGDLTYSEVATNCSGIAGVLLYYQKAGHFGMIAQESTASDKETAAIIRKRFEAGLANATNFK